MALLANVALTDTFDTWRTVTNQHAQLLDVLIEGGHLTTGTITSTNTGAAINVSAGYILVGANTFSSNAVALVSNTGTIGISGIGELGTNLYIDILDNGQGFADQSNANVAHANVVNALNLVVVENYKTSNGAFYHANVAYDTSNGAFYHSNTAFNLANNNLQNVTSSFHHANASFKHANAAFDLANNNLQNVTASFGHANASFKLANNNLANVTASFHHANAAFDLANTLDALSGNQGTLIQQAQRTGDGAFYHANSAYDRANVSATWVYANTIGAASNTWANNVGTAGNNYMLSVATAANNASIARDTAGNNYTVSVGAASNTWSNTKVSSVSGTSGRITSSGGTTPTIDLASGVITAQGYGGSGISSITVDTYGRVTAVGTATYLTGINSTLVTNALGYTPYNSSNPSGYITASASITGSAYTLAGDETNWANYRSRTVSNFISWKNYGNGHVIFDASNSTAPNGASVNNTNPTTNWSASYPTLMGWNGSQTYGIRVDVCRRADSAASADTASSVAWSNVSGSPTNISYFTNNSGYVTATQASWTPSGSGTGTFTISGYLSVTQTGTFGTSDERLKTDITTIDNALDKMDLIKGIRYRNNDVAASYGYETKDWYVGVLSQDMEKVLPEVVKPAPFDLSEDGTSKSGEDYKTVQYEKIVPLLIQAIKELKARVEELESK